jgi:hypothetical protein
MPIPQVTDRIKEAPAVVLRAIFAGIGQVLMAADKIRAQVQEQFAQPAARPTEPKPPQAPRRPVAEETGNVTLLREREQPTGKQEERAAAAAPPPATPAVRPALAAQPPTTAAQPPTAAAQPPAAATGPAPAAPKPALAAQPPSTPAKAGVDGPPVAGYDDLSIASVRARLRVLDAPAVHALLDYEKAHAGRGDFITMFERRLAKIESKAG